MQAQDAPLVVICDDVGAAPAPLRLLEFEARLSAQVPGTRVAGVPGMCERPRALAGALSGLCPTRVVLGCRAASHARGGLLAGLRRAGVAVVGSDIVDLKPAEICDERVVLEQSIALLRAGLARVVAVDAEAPVRERTSFSVAGVSRRSLLRGLELSLRPVAVRREERCAGGAACTGCLAACRHGALLKRAGRVVVDVERCAGCGACVVACRNGAFALPGADLGGLRAAVGALVQSIRGGTPATGVAIVCQNSTTAPRLGEAWLALRVPSLEMVSAGWLLQLMSARVGVRLAPCEDDECELRADDLERFVRDLAEATGFSTKGPVGDPGWDLSNGQAQIELCDPEATMQVLAGLGALEAGRSGWRVEGRGCPFGSVHIDPQGCSCCGACVSVCPRGALTVDTDDSGSLCLNLDPARCSACGACVVTCPEKVISLERSVDGAVVAAGTTVVVVATQPAAACDLCGSPLGVRLSPEALLRAGGSHRFLAAGAESLCADCRLSGRSAVSAR